MQSTTKLCASPNDPQMLQAIKYAQSHAQAKTTANAWSKPKVDGEAITFQTLGGPIVLSRAEIAEANELYPLLVRRAKDPHTYRSSGSSTGSDYTDDGLHDRRQWGD